MIVETKTNPFTNGNETFDYFDVEFHLLNIIM